MVVPRGNYLSVKKTRKRKPWKHIRAEWIPTTWLVDTFISLNCVLVTQIPDENLWEQRFTVSDSQLHHGVVGRDRAESMRWGSVEGSSGPLHHSKPGSGTMLSYS